MSDKAKNSVWMAGLIYGSVLGAVSIIVSVIFYVLGKSMSDLEKYVSLGITTILLVYLLYMYRNEYLDGYAKYGNIVSASLIIAFVSGILGAIYFIVLVKWIDPGIQRIIDDKALEGMLQQLDKRGISPSSGEIDDMMEQTKVFRGSVFTSIVVLFFSALIGTLTGLIAGIFLKKENPDPFSDVKSDV